MSGQRKTLREHSSFLSVVAVPITSRSHGKDRKVKVKEMSVTGRFLGPGSTCRVVVSAGLPPEPP